MFSSLSILQFQDSGLSSIQMFLGLVVKVKVGGAVSRGLCVEIFVELDTRGVSRLLERHGILCSFLHFVIE